MNLKNSAYEETMKKLVYWNTQGNLIDKLVLHSDDNWVHQFLEEIDNTSDLNEAFNQLLEKFLLLRFQQHPQYVSKEEIPKIFPISKRKFDELVRARLVPFIQINQKNRIFNLDDIYKHFETYKVDSLVYRIDPVTLNNLINR